MELVWSKFIFLWWKSRNKSISSVLIRGKFILNFQEKKNPIRLNCVCGIYLKSISSSALLALSLISECIQRIWNFQFWRFCFIFCCVCINFVPGFNSSKLSKRLWQKWTCVKVCQALWLLVLPVTLPRVISLPWSEIIYLRKTIFLCDDVRIL